MSIRARKREQTLSLSATLKTTNFPYFSIKIQTMKNFISLKHLSSLVLLLLIMLECTNAPKLEKANTPEIVTFKNTDTLVAAKFINDYVELQNKRVSRLETMEWINANDLLTDEFKDTYLKMQDDALQADPELGLDFDPIMNAQDYPEEGFVISTFSSKTGEAVLIGKEWNTFNVTLKLKMVGDKCLINEAGVIHPKPSKIKKIETH